VRADEVTRSHYDAQPMAALELDDEELKLVRTALHALLDDFGHGEADVVARLQALIAKLPAEDGSAQPSA
jgi:hypothetical protein